MSQINYRFLVVFSGKHLWRNEVKPQINTARHRLCDYLVYMWAKLIKAHVLCFLQTLHFVIVDSLFGSINWEQRFVMVSVSQCSRIFWPENGNFLSSKHEAISIKSLDLILTICASYFLRVKDQTTRLSAAHAGASVAALAEKMSCAP